MSRNNPVSRALDHAHPLFLGFAVGQAFTHGQFFIGALVAIGSVGALISEWRAVMNLLDQFRDIARGAQ